MIAVREACSENLMSVVEGIMASAALLDTVAVPIASIAVAMEMLNGAKVSGIFNRVATAESPDGTADDAIMP